MGRTYHKVEIVPELRAVCTRATRRKSASPRGSARAKKLRDSRPRHGRRGSDQRGIRTPQRIGIETAENHPLNGGIEIPDQPAEYHQIIDCQKRSHNREQMLQHSVAPALAAGLNSPQHLTLHPLLALLLSLARNGKWISFFPSVPRFFFFPKPLSTGIEKLLAFLYPRAL